MKNKILTKPFTGISKIHQGKLWILLALGLSTMTAMANEADNRLVLNLSKPQRNHVLGEMRSLLAGTQTILGALAKDDMATVAEQSKAQGFNIKPKSCKP